MIVAGDASPRRSINNVAFIRQDHDAVEAPIAEHHHDEGITSLLRRIRSEFIEMPGLRLTPAQAARLWGMERHVGTHPRRSGAGRLLVEDQRGRVSPRIRGLNDDR